MKDYYQDVIRDGEGRVRRDTGWRSNRIVHSCDRLLAALMKRQEHMQGILYLAVGEGEKQWDAQPPTPLPSTFQLAKEVSRRQVTEDGIIYLDSQSRNAGSATNRLQITVDLPGSELTSSGYQSLREFGLFGGDATDAPDSGFMINYVIHARIDLTPDVTLTRQIQLTFENAVVFEPPELPEHWLGEASIVKLDGVGQAYEDALAGAGISTIYGLARTDPLACPSGLPQMKLVELQAKARLALCTAVEISSIPALPDRTVSEIITTPVDALIAETGVPEPLIQRVRQQAGTLEITLDNQVIKNVTIRELTQLS